MRKLVAILIVFGVGLAVGLTDNPVRDKANDLVMDAKCLVLDNKKYVPKVLVDEFSVSDKLKCSVRSGAKKVQKSLSDFKKKSK